MDSLWNTVDVNRNIVKLLQSRERLDDHGKVLKHNCQFTAPLLKRLHLVHNLEGHQGCVNCIQWSNDGRTLASGSDDTIVRIWDPFANKCLQVVPTKHIGNIFSVKFVGDGNIIATGAGDCRVIVQSIEDTERQALVDCSCHGARVKRLATAPDCPSLFWSAGEDGLIIQYDMREQHECSKNATAFLDLCQTVEFKCIAVNPTRPHLIAIGANDCYVRLYDRRFVKTSKLKLNATFDPRKRTAPEPQDPNCVQYFAPGHLARDNGGDISFKLLATYIAFDSTGNDLLVNMGGDHIYLFDINNTRGVNQLLKPDGLPKTATPTKSVGPLKDCCKIAIPMMEPNATNGDKHNYRFSNDNPCACDYIGRARRVMRRQYIGDAYFAARDFLHVIEHWPFTIAAYLGLIECLIMLQWADAAKEWVEYCQAKFPVFADDRNMKKLTDDLKSLNENGKRPVGVLEELTEGVPHETVEVSDEEKLLRIASYDYQSRYLGHCNTTTDIKEVNFMGNDGNYICAGSDDGLIFVWDRKTTNLLTALVADVSIVNCVQPHPSICYLASSGIDSGVKIWSPMNEDIENFKNCCAIKDLHEAMEANQDRMSMDPFDTMLINMGFRDVRTERTATGQTHASCRTC